MRRVVFLVLYVTLLVTLTGCGRAKNDTEPLDYHTLSFDNCELVSETDSGKLSASIDGNNLLLSFEGSDTFWKMAYIDGTGYMETPDRTIQCVVNKTVNSINAINPVTDIDFTNSFVSGEESVDGKLCDILIVPITDFRFVEVKEGVLSGIGPGESVTDLNGETVLYEDAPESIHTLYVTKDTHEIVQACLCDKGVTTRYSVHSTHGIELSKAMLKAETVEEDVFGRTLFNVFLTLRDIK